MTASYYTTVNSNGLADLHTDWTFSWTEGTKLDKKNKIKLGFNVQGKADGKTIYETTETKI